MELIDASGPIHEGMWSYGDPFPHFKLIELKTPGREKGVNPKQQAFKGFHIFTGSYISCPAHAFGIEKTYAAHEVPLEKLFDIDAYVLKFDLKRLSKEGNRPYISLKDIKEAEKEEIPVGAPILVGTGWGEHWDKPDYLTHSWFFKKDAIEYIVTKKPSLLGGKVF